MVYNCDKFLSHCKQSNAKLVPSCIVLQYLCFCINSDKCRRHDKQRRMNKIMLNRFLVVLYSDIMLCINSQTHRCHSFRNISAIGGLFPTTIQGMKFIAQQSHVVCSSMQCMNILTMTWEKNSQWIVSHIWLQQQLRCYMNIMHLQFRYSQSGKSSGRVMSLGNPWTC